MQLLWPADLKAQTGDRWGKMKLSGQERVSMSEDRQEMDGEDEGDG